MRSTLVCHRFFMMFSYARIFQGFGDGTRWQSVFAKLSLSIAHDLVLSLAWIGLVSP